jgi:acyl-CoA synthetase (NDP forming)
MVSPSILSELRPFFYPRAIAVAGVSRDPTKFGSCVFRSLQKFGFSGPLYPVGRQATELLGVKVYPSISAIPGEVDLLLRILLLI